MKMWKLSLLATAMITSTSLFAQGADAPAAAEGSNMSQTLIMVGLLLVFFYFILWRPEQKRRKAMEKQRSSIRKGDRVTAMGIIGTVVKIQEKTLVLKMYDGSKIEMLKAGISEVIPGNEECSDDCDDKEKK